MRASRVLVIIPRVVAIGVLLFTTLFPLAWIVSTSLKANNEILVFPPKFLPAHPTLDNFRAFFASDRTLAFFGNSLIATGVSTVLTIAIATPAAYALAAHRFPRDVGRHIALGFLLLRFLPAFAVVIPIFVVLRQAGLIDTVFALIIVYTAFHLPLAIWIVRPAAAQLPIEIREAATVDGAGPIRAFWYVILPLLRPSVATAAALCAIFSWNEFFFALIFTNSNAETYPVLISSFVTDSGPEWGSIAVASLMAIIPIVALCAVLQRHLVSGLTSGAVR